MDTLSAAADGAQLVTVDPLAINGLGGTGGRKMLAKPEDDGGKAKEGAAQDDKPKNGGGDKKGTEQGDEQDGEAGGGDTKAAAAAAGAGSEAVAADLPLANEKGQCYSKKHALAPDEEACAAYCEAKVGAGICAATVGQGCEQTLLRKGCWVWAGAQRSLVSSNATGTLRA